MSRSEDKFWSTLTIWRSGIAIGIGAIVFLQQNSIGRREFDEYKSANQKLGDEVLRRVEQRFDSVEQAQTRMESKIDRLSSKSAAQKGSLVLNTNLYNRSFSTTP